MSTTLTLARVGFAPGVPEEILHKAAFAYPVALVVSLFLTPIVRWFVQQITKAQPTEDKRSPERSAQAIGGIMLSDDRTR